MGCKFSGPKEFKDNCLLLQNETGHKHRMHRGNNADRISINCSTFVGSKLPENVEHACQFFVRTSVDLSSGVVTVQKANLEHTACTTETNKAAKRNKLTVPKADASAAAAAVVGTTKIGKLSHAVRSRLERDGHEVSKSTIDRAVAEANAYRSKCVDNETFGKIAAYGRAFNDVDEDNSSILETVACRALLSIELFS